MEYNKKASDNQGKNISERVLSFNRRRKLKKYLIGFLFLVIVCGIYVIIKGGDVSFSGFGNDVVSAFNWIKDSVGGLFEKKENEQVAQTKHEIPKDKESENKINSTQEKPTAKIPAEENKNTVIEPAYNEHKKKLDRFNEICDEINDKTAQLNKISDRKVIEKEFEQIQILYEEANKIYQELPSSKMSSEINKKHQLLILNFKEWRRRMKGE